MNIPPLFLTVALCFHFTLAVYFLRNRLAASPAPARAAGNGLPSDRAA